MNDSGSYIPPMLICPRVLENMALLDGAPDGSVARFNKTGYMKKQIFCDWLTFFVKYAMPSKENKIILVLDGHSTHVKNLDAIQYSIDNNVYIVCLPPHTSHKMQPLDVSFMNQKILQ